MKAKHEDRIYRKIQKGTTEKNLESRKAISDLGQNKWGLTGLNAPTFPLCNSIVRVQYFVRGGFVGHRSRASSKHLSPHLPVDGARFLGGQKGVGLHLQDARVGVGSTKKPTPLDVDVRRSDVTALALSYRTFPLRKV
ncbi:uncharacterized protein TNCV_3659211 [Trichonephila clavipes]|nr:uncharacterized protein TNCV_3659211 [Trichonephila clavipes]